LYFKRMSGVNIHTIQTQAQSLAQA
jgi:hypothetical protein